MASPEMTPKNRNSGRIPSRDHSRKVRARALSAHLTPSKSLAAKASAKPLPFHLSPLSTSRSSPPPHPPPFPLRKNETSPTRQISPSSPSSTTSSLQPASLAALTAITTSPFGNPLIDLSRLLNPSNYHHLPAPDLPYPPTTKLKTTDSSIEELLSDGQYRLAAVAAANTLTDPKATSSTDHESIFSLLYVRLATLTLLNLTALATAEAAPLLTLLFDSPTTQILSPPVPEQKQQQHRRRSSYVATVSVPWELRVLAIRLLALSSDNWRRALMSYYELAREARANISAHVVAVAKTEKETTASLWQNRLYDLGIRVANALIEIGDLQTAALHLASLGSASETEDVDEANIIGDNSMRLREALAWLSLGNVQAAESCLKRMSFARPNSSNSFTAQNVLAALLQIANGKFTAAAESWKASSKAKQDSEREELGPEHSVSPLVDQNRAICSFYAGNMNDARALLENIVKQTPPFHTLMFNLATIYELYGERAQELKMDLMHRATASSRNAGGGELIAADFKL